MAGDVAGQGLADLAADLVDARRIDHDEPGSFEAGPVGRVVLPALGGPGDGRAVGRADLKDVLAHEGVQDRRLAPADHAERGDLDRGLVELLAQVAQLGELAGEGGLFLGGQLEARQGGFEAFPGALDRRVVFGGVRVELVEQFFELFIGHGMSLSLPPGSDRLFAPLGDSQKLDVAGRTSRPAGSRPASRRAPDRSGTRRSAARCSSRAN